jgi:hypothetical protein
MKASHFKTPRTMEEGTWHPWGASIERPLEEPPIGFWDVVMILAAVAVLSAAVFLVFKIGGLP